jgi:hypothetical protein
MPLARKMELYQVWLSIVLRAAEPSRPVLCWFV